MLDFGLFFANKVCHFLFLMFLSSFHYFLIITCRNLINNNVCHKSPLSQMKTATAIRLPLQFVIHNALCYKRVKFSLRVLKGCEMTHFIYRYNFAALAHLLYCPPDFPVLPLFKRFRVR